jgi:hypothetical protein
MNSMNWTHRLILGGVMSISFTAIGLCATDPCDAIVIANKATMQSKYTTTSKPTGVQLVPYMGKIHMHSKDHSCKFVRNDSINGEAVGIYTQHMASPEGSTDEEFWISKRSDKILREEIDGEIAGSGHGHLSMLYHY